VTPRISVALPCHNAATTLPAALTSLLAQTFADFEILAVNDGSTDATGQVLTEFARRDARVRPLHLPENRGIVAALAAAIESSRGGLIARMDADDTCPPERFAAQTALLDADPGLDLVSGRVRFGGDRVARLGYALHVDWLNTLATHQDISVNRFVESPLAHPSVLFRRESYDRYGGYRQGPFPEDYEIWLRWLGQGARMAKCEACVLVWNDPPGRLSRTHPAYSNEGLARCRAMHLIGWLRANNPRHPRVWCWGAGRESRRRLAPAVERGLKVERYVDIDPRKVGQKVHGVHVLDCEAIARAGHPYAPFVLINVGARGAREEILDWLVRRGYRPGVDCMAVG
jgi:glycosyltransferase involved in cell wall biosynthesis